MITKRISYYSLLTCVIALLSVSGSVAQVPDCNPNGTDSALTLRNYSLMHEEVKFKHYAEAKETWLYVFNNAPCFREQTYVDGIEIYLDEIGKTTDETRKKQLIDTLTLIYQNRIKYFGNEGLVKGKWGKDLLELDPKNPEPGLKLIEESIALQGNKLEDNLIVPYFKTLISLEKKGLRAKNDILTTYEKLTEIVDYNMSHVGEPKLGIYKSPYKLTGLAENTFVIDRVDGLETDLVLTLKPSYSSPRYTVTNMDSIYVTVDKNITEPEGSPIFYVKEAWTVAQENLNALAAPYLDCETLSQIYTPKFDAEPTNPELLAKILLFLNNAKCTNSELYFKVAEANLAINPTALGFRNLANAYRGRKNYSKALEVYQKAAELETQGKLMVNDYLNMAKIALINKNAGQAKTYAEKALSIDPNRGEAYLLIGDAYLLAAGGCSEFDAQAIYWVVVDQYIKAKNTDPGVAGAANRRIATYSRYFPKKADAFFYGITAGQSYTLKCYPNLTTTARFVE